MQVALSAALDEALAYGSRWFPCLDHARIRARVADRTVRPRCSLFQVELTDGVAVESVMVKVRRPTAGRHIDQARPSLMPISALPEPEMTRLEFDGLGQIATRLGDLGEGRWSVLRPLAVRPEHSMLIMDYVPLPTLRSVLMAGSRFSVYRTGPGPDCASSNAGAWLRAYHDGNPHDDAAPRNADRAGLMSAYGLLVDHLRTQLLERTFLDAFARRIERVVAQSLPADFPLVRGHGDFAARNILVGPSASVTVLDPMPRWLVPPQKDLAQFLVGMRLTGVQVASRGLAFSRPSLDRCERAVLAGYYGIDDIPVSTVNALQLLIVLDSWSALVDRSGAGPGARVRLRWFSRYYTTEAMRLLQLLTAATGSASPPTHRCSRCGNVHQRA